MLLGLPQEVLIIIIRKLDLRSLLNLYHTCTTMRSILSMHGVVKKCCMSRNTMATVNTLKLSFFKDISCSLIELNMCGVPDLNKTTVIAAMKKLKRLKLLDISFTKLDILDFIDIHKVCPTIKDITINLQCGKYGNVPKDIRLQCQSVFQHFINVHFVGSLVNLLCSNFIMFILAKSKLHHLKYTQTESPSSFVINDSLTDDDHIRKSSQSTIPDFDQFTAFSMDWKYRSTPTMLEMNLSDLPVLTLFKIEKYEYLAIAIEQFETKVYASPMFKEFFKERFHIIVDCTKYDINLSQNVAVMLWNKSTTNFNNMFYYKLTKVLKQYLPCYFLSSSENTKFSSFEYDWFYTEVSELVEEKSELIVKRIGNKRVASAPKLILNYDDMFQGKENVELTLVFKISMNSVIGLTSNSEYLRKLTYLSLLHFGRHSSDFFNVLFRCCVNLTTLNVSGSGPCASTIARSLPLSQSLKNLRLVDRLIDFRSLFTSFTQCTSLENIHIADVSVLRNDLANPTLVVEQCYQLYSMFITAEMTLGTKTEITQLFNRAKKLYNKSFLYVLVKANSESTPMESNYDTFIDVFRLTPLRSILR